MRALVIHQHGGPGVLTLEPDWPRPEPGPGEIVVNVHACALNPLDVFAREGMPGEPIPLPQITGGDIAGIVAYAQWHWQAGPCRFEDDGSRHRRAHGDTRWLA